MATGQGLLFAYKQGTFLKLLALGILISRANAQQNICPSTVANRIDCGQDGISQEQCENERNCCFDDSVRGSIFCFQPDQCENVEPASRTDCGFPSISRGDCIRLRCCFDDRSYPGLPDPIYCFLPTTALSPPVAPGECRPSDIYMRIEELVNQWIDLVTTKQTVQSVLRNSNIFSISTYCGLYADTINNIIACAVKFAGPFFSFSQSANNTFYQNLNRIDSAKSICGALANQADPGNPVCIPGAVPVCSLLAFDLLATFAESVLDNIDAVCQSTEMIVRSIPTCITLATGSCTEEQKRGYQSVIRTFNDIADGLDTYCLSGCAELIRFALDDDAAMCSWNVNRFVGSGSNYCEYVIYTVECAYMLWESCPILPEEYFQKALSVLEPGLLAAGCTSSIEEIISEFEFNPAFKVPIPACVNAGILCARELAFAVGVEQLAGPFGGYTLDQVDNRLNTILEELKEGNYQSFCGNPAQRVAQGNPISNCITDLLDGCGSSANDLQQRLANTAAEWYDEACVPGCTTLASKLINFGDTCPLPRWVGFDLRGLPLDIFLAAAPNGASQNLCRPIRDFAICISELIEECTFLHNRAIDGRNLLVKTITGGREDLPLDIFICGIHLDYPFKPDPKKKKVPTATLR